MKRVHKSKGSLVAVLDVGNTKIACFIARVLDDEGNFEVIGAGHRASEGIKSGSIIDLDKAEASVRNTIHAAENMAADIMRGYPLREVVVNLPGVHGASYGRTAQVDISGHEVTDKDISSALMQAQNDLVQEPRELIHTIPVSYQIDGKQGVSDPRGMYGQAMDVDIHLVSAERAALRNITTCIERSHLDIEALCLSSYAAGLSSLVEDEMTLGCTVIDLGGGITSFAVFQNGALIFADALPVGADHVTQDIAKGLTTSVSDAERIKVLYGSAMASVSDDAELIDVPRLGEGQSHEPHHIPRSLLVGIIQPRLEEIFELVRAKLNDSGLGPAVSRRVVLTGGGSLMPGIRNLSQHVLDKQVRIGRPIRSGDLPDAVSGPAFATTAGLITYVMQRLDEAPGQAMSQIDPGTFWERTKLWLRENW